MHSEKKVSEAIPEHKKVGMLLPPPLLMVILGALAVGVHLLLKGAFIIKPLTAVMGGVLLVAGGVLVVVCVRHFQAQGTPVVPVSRPATAIVGSGPYAYSRNPMYVGMALLLAGLGLVLNSYFLGVAVVLFGVIIHFGVVLPEERYLLSLHGERYRQYLADVRRWL